MQWRIFRYSVLNKKCRVFIFTAVAVFVCALIVLGYDRRGSSSTTVYNDAQNSSFTSEEIRSYRNRFLITNFNACESFAPWIVIFVLSAPNNFDYREFIRTSWGRKGAYSSKKVLVFFLLAAIGDGKIQFLIDAEQKKNEDIIQDGSFVDSYRNLSYKSLSMLVWTTAFCPKAKLILKVDDDSFLLPSRLDDWLMSLEASNSWPAHSIIGHIWSRPDPIRRPNSRWYVSKEEWPGEYFAEKACSGSGYLITADSVVPLLKASQSAPHLWIEDMYITGVLAEAAGLTHISDFWYHILKYRGGATYPLILFFYKVFIIGSVPDLLTARNIWRFFYFSDLTNFFICSFLLLVPFFLLRFLYKKMFKNKF